MILIGVESGVCLALTLFGGRGSHRVHGEAETWRCGKWKSPSQSCVLLSVCPSVLESHVAPGHSGFYGNGPMTRGRWCRDGHVWARLALFGLGFERTGGPEGPGVRGPHTQLLLCFVLLTVVKHTEHNM